MCVSLTLITLHMIRTWEIMEVYMQVFLEKGSQNSQSRIRTFIRRGKSPQLSFDTHSHTLRKVKLSTCRRGSFPREARRQLCTAFSSWPISLPPVTPKWQPHRLRAQVALHHLSAPRQHFQAIVLAVF